MNKYIRLFAIVVAFIGIINPTSRAIAATQTESLLIVFDASGSMSDQFDNTTRIDAAKSTISSLVASLDASTVVGVRALAQQKKDVKTDACKVTSLIQSFTTDHTAVTNQVNSLQAVGAYTPLAYTLQQAAGDFTVGQYNVLILMTDGQENCGGDPAAAAAALLKANVNVKTYVIGIDADSATRDQLTSIANAGGGTYYNATDAASLATSFNAIQAREHAVMKVNTDTLLGTEVTGGNGFETAVPITPGMYHLSHFQLGSEYDYFKMDVKAGDVINLSLQSSESSYGFDPKTNSFFSKNNHNGDYAGVSIYSATRAKLDSVSESYASTISKSDYTVQDDGSIYFLFGNNESHDSIMGKGDIITIKVKSAAGVATPAATVSPTPVPVPVTPPPTVTPIDPNYGGGTVTPGTTTPGTATPVDNGGTTSGSSGGTSSGTTPGSTQTPSDPGTPSTGATDPGSTGNTGAGSDISLPTSLPISPQAIIDAANGAKNTFFTIAAIASGVGLLTILAIVLIIIFVIRANNKKKLAATSAQVATQQQPPVVSAPPAPPVPPVATN